MAQPSARGDNMTDRKPRIVLFQCQWCLYTEIDQHWVDHDLPSNIQLIKVPCTGRINPLFILNAVQGGADGIMICGCVPEKCHFKEGNFSARRQLDEFANFLVFTGFDIKRIRFTWIDLQEQGRIQRELSSMENDLFVLGPSVALATRHPLEGEQS